MTRITVSPIGRCQIEQNIDRFWSLMSDVIGRGLVRMDHPSRQIKRVLTGRRPPRADGRACPLAARRGGVSVRDHVHRQRRNMASRRSSVIGPNLPVWGFVFGAGSAKMRC
jgi:hypothetical protein